MASPNYLVTLNQVEPLRGALVAVRRRLHAHPELSGEERWTAALVADRLAFLGFEVESGVGGHGVVGLLRGSRPGPTVAYRADMDAMPVQDALDQPYSSLVLGVKHACGHDAHVAIGLGVAEILRGVRDVLPGTVKMIFQPAEESLDGARAMLAAGVLDDPAPQAMVALHTFPIPAGAIGVTPGLCLAGMEEFRVRFYAPSGNLDALISRAIAALTGLSTSAPPTDAEALDDVMAQMTQPGALRDTIFLSCWRQGEVHQPPYHLLGLVSITDFARRGAVRARIRRTLDRVTAAMGATYDLTYTFANPPLRNDPHLVARVAPVAAQVAGEDQVMVFQSPYPFAHEDFALFAERLPAVFLWLGTADRARGITSIHHTADYDIDEDALVTGVSVAASILRYLLTTGVSGS